MTSEEELEIANIEVVYTGKKYYYLVIQPKENYLAEMIIAGIDGYRLVQVLSNKALVMEKIIE